MPASLLATSLFLGLAFAAPSPQPQQSTFTLQQVDTGGKVLKSATVDMMRFFERYGPKMHVTGPPALMAAGLAIQNGSVPAMPSLYQTEYLTQVILGSDSVFLELDLATADLWATSIYTPANEAAGHRLYNPTKSGTVLPGYTFGFRNPFNGDSFSGLVYNDTVSMAGFVVQGQAVGALNSEMGYLADSNKDGSLGLAFAEAETIKPAPVPTLFDSLKKQLSKALFTVSIPKDGAGSYDFGFIDKSKYQGAISYVPRIDFAGLWTFNVSGYSTGNEATIPLELQTSAFDTSSDLLVANSLIAEDYYKQVPSADSSLGIYAFPCNTTLPDLHLSIGGYNATFPGTNLNYGPIDTIYGIKTNDLCAGVVQSSGFNGLSVFGSAFFNSVFTVFDQSKTQPRLGFASKKGSK